MNFVSATNKQCTIYSNGASRERGYDETATSFALSPARTRQSSLQSRDRYVPAVSTERSEAAAKIRRERAALRAEYGELYDWLARALYEHDPIGINFGQGADEYEPEVGTILPRLAACSSRRSGVRVAPGAPPRNAQKLSTNMFA